MRPFGKLPIVNIDSIPTPALILDKPRLIRNLDRMRSKAERSNVIFRPHVKTHKSVEIGRLQFAGRVGPITVSTLSEAEFFADDGFRDITYAFPIAPDKLARAAALARRIDRLSLLFDHPRTLDAVESFARDNGCVFDLWLKVDCGYHRAGVDPDDPASLDLALRSATSASVLLHGFLTHAGHSYQASTRDEILSIAFEEISVLQHFRRKFEDAGGRKGMAVSVGSTPTAAAVDSFEGADEVRPGNYVFFDAFQAAVGSSTLDDAAALVLTEVVGVYPSQNKIMVDAGALALSKDLGATHLGGRGYGVVLDLNRQQLPLEIFSLSQEHGQVHAHRDHALSVGDRLLIVPNHSCLTAALFDRYYVIAEGKVIDEWRPARGW